MMKKFFSRSTIIIAISICLLATFTGCKTKEEPINNSPPSTGDLIDSNPLILEQPSMEIDPEDDASPTQTQPWRIDENALTDDYLISIVMDMEIAQTGDNSFTFNDPTELSSQVLYMSFLILTDYYQLEKYQSQEDSMFYFTSDVITAELSKYFKSFSFDITDVIGHDPQANAVVTWTASGFGGDRYMKVTGKEIDGNTVSFTADFYLEGYTEIYQSKTYSIEFYERGYYFLSARSADTQQHSGAADNIISTASEESLYSLLSGSILTLSDDLIEEFYLYYRAHVYELRLLPRFGGGEMPSWDELTHFIFVNTETQVNELGYRYINDSQFDETVSKYFGQLDYTHKSSTYVTYSDGIYTSTGWDVMGSYIYRLTSIEDNGDGSLIAEFDGIYLRETDYTSLYDEASNNMKKIMDSAGIKELPETSLKEWLNTQILNILLSDDYFDVFDIDETVKIQFNLACYEESPFFYIACER